VNNTYRDLVLSRIKTAVSEAQALGGIENAGLKGQLREIVIHKLLRPLFPSDVGVGTGVIITASGSQSRQQDVVIFDKRILPPILLEQSEGLFPIESVLYAIEVKSTLNASELKKSHASAEKLRTFLYTTGKYEGDVGVSHSIRYVLSTVLAFNTDLTGTGKTEYARYQEIAGSDSGIPPIVAICVAGASYCYWHGTSWLDMPITYQYEALVGFIAGIQNTYKDIAASRGSPRLGQYLL
jgi:hypothetical protein